MTKYLFIEYIRVFMYSFIYFTFDLIYNFVVATAVWPTNEQCYRWVAVAGKTYVIDPSVGGSWERRHFDCR